MVLGLVLSAAAANPLRVGTSADYPPFSKSGRGFDVDVAERLAAALGREVVWVRFRWPELPQRLARGDFDVVMSGVTWRPEREVSGYATRAVAAGAPCIVGAADPRRVAVNRGGFLESWARKRLPDAEVVAVPDNPLLAGYLARGDVDALVTDTFEAVHVRRPEWKLACEPPRYRKVYWVSPTAPATLGTAIDRWIGEHEGELRALRGRWLGGPMPRDDVDHVVDLLARRLEMMPLVAAWKRAHHAPVEDRPREAAVIARAADSAARHALDVEAVRGLFFVQIDLAKTVQQRSTGAETEIDLAKTIRPALGRIDERVIQALERAVPISAAALSPERLAPLALALDEAEIERLRHALLALRRSSWQNPQEGPIMPPRRGGVP
ncbi:MAG: cyclohexadienyl dehydratase [Candidatus Binatota bacterium]|nr:cyclohexadienyl dehydratase [Candidatus Binatota bacterium]